MQANTIFEHNGHALSAPDLDSPDQRLTDTLQSIKPDVDRIIAGALSTK
jgi:hypothetical protein